MREYQFFVKQVIFITLLPVNFLSYRYYFILIIMRKISVIFLMSNYAYRRSVNFQLSSLGSIRSESELPSVIYLWSEDCPLVCSKYHIMQNSPPA